MTGGKWKKRRAKVQMKEGRRHGDLGCPKSLRSAQRERVLFLSGHRSPVTGHRLPLATGLTRSIDFLRSHTDTVSTQGSVVGTAPSCLWSAHQRALFAERVLKRERRAINYNSEPNISHHHLVLGSFTAFVFTVMLRCCSTCHDTKSLWRR